ncbi:MAG: NifU N-terminal domain-containing protein [Caldilineaceae bacterium]
MSTPLIPVRATPNPNARKFVLPAQHFMQPINCSTVESAAAHPLAARLFAIDGVYNVLLAQDFVTLNKRPEMAWEPLETRAIATIADWLTQGGPE